MFVGAVARDMGVKVHLTLILEAKAMHRKRQQVCGKGKQLNELMFNKLPIEELFI